MDLGSAAYIFKTAVMQILVLSAPVLGVSLAVGLLVAVFQAATSLQEQTLTFVPKLIAVLLVLMLLGTWMFTSMSEYAVHLLNMIPDMIR